jgi:hypothetical protein
MIKSVFILSILVHHTNNSMTVENFSAENNSIKIYDLYLYMCYVP